MVGMARIKTINRIDILPIVIVGIVGSIGLLLLDPERPFILGIQIQKKQTAELYSMDQEGVIHPTNSE